jgi:DNA repair ATPase RecN
VAAKAPHHIHLKKQLHEDRVEVVATILSDTEARTSVLSQIASGYTTQDKVTSEFIEQLLR